MNSKWNLRFLEMADLVASWSKDPSTKVGAVIVDANKRVVSVGYNGFPRGVDDMEARYNDRQLKYKLVCHAERNALDNASLTVDGCTMFVTFPSCNECMKSIIQKGIKHIVVRKTDREDNYNWKEAIMMAEESGVSITFI